MLEMLIGAVLEGVTGTAAAAGGGAVARKLKERKRGAKSSTFSDTVRAVGEAVEVARGEVIAELEKAAGRADGGELEQAQEDLLTLMRHPSFCEEVAEKLVVRGLPDFERLREAYFEFADPGRRTERWAALEAPLTEFFLSVEGHLRADPHLGELLRHRQGLAALAAIRGGQEETVEELRLITRYVAASAESEARGERRLASIEDVLRAYGDTLNEFLAALRQRLEPVALASGATATTSHLSPEEKRYLRSLAKRCDRLDLAYDRRDADRNRREVTASLSRVYVRLDTETPAPWPLVCARCGISDDDGERLLAELRGKSGARAGSRAEMEDELAGAARAAAGGEPLAQALVAAWKRGEPESLRRAIPDEAALRAATGPLSAHEAVRDEASMILLGDPGAGKSTLLNHLTVTFAGALLQPEAGWRDELGGCFDAALFPVRIDLRELAARVREQRAEDGDATPRGVELIYEALERLPGEVPRKRWKARLEDRRTLLLLDGLDELPGADDPGVQEELREDLRKTVVAAIGELRVQHEDCRMVATCRVKPFESSPGYRLPGFAVHRLAGLAGDEIRRFVRRWYDEQRRLGQLEERRARRARERLFEAIADPDRRELSEMATSPLLLTMLARVNARDRLPERRSKLYAACVRQLLWEWERPRAEAAGTESLESLLGEPRRAIEPEDFERRLGKLCFEAFERGGGGATLSAARLREELAELHPTPHQNRRWASRVVALMRSRSGLFVAADDDSFGVPHPSFQEYLAAGWLLAQDRMEERLWELAADSRWEEVVLLACGRLAGSDTPRRVLDVVNELVERPGAGDERWQRILVAGRAWRDCGAERWPAAAEPEQAGEPPPFADRLRVAVPDALRELMWDGKRPPAQRLAAGWVLDDLEVLPDDLDAWVEIPASGPLARFKIGKYPVTNHQYREFVDAGGYQPDRPWWSDEARREILKVQELLGAEGWPSGPRTWDWNDRRYRRPSVPVTGVSWHEAKAYCAWRTQNLRTAGRLGDDEVVRLPTDDEWRLAAAGEEGREFPWVGKHEPVPANVAENELGGPTPVHLFPGGATPGDDPVWDLCGNVWEWLEDREGGSPALAGGSFLTNEASAASRDRGHPANGGGNYGFRVVVVPISRANSES